MKGACVGGGGRVLVVSRTMQCVIVSLASCSTSGCLQLTAARMAQNQGSVHVSCF